MLEKYFGQSLCCPKKKLILDKINKNFQLYLIQMKKILIVISLFIFTGCASANWVHQNSNNSNLSFDKGECRSFANSRSPTYLCKNPFYCEPDEWTDVLSSISQNNSTFDYCMYQKGYKPI